MRTIGGLGYLVIVASIGTAIDRMAVSLYDAGSAHRHDLAAAWTSAAATPPARPATGTATEPDCAKPLTPATLHSCAAAMATPAAREADPLGGIADLWAVIRRL